MNIKRISLMISAAAIAMAATHAVAQGADDPLSALYAEPYVYGDDSHNAFYTIETLFAVALSWSDGNLSSDEELTNARAVLIAKSYGNIAKISSYTVDDLIEMPPKELRKELNKICDGSVGKKKNICISIETNLMTDAMLADLMSAN